MTNVPMKMEAFEEKQLEMRSFKPTQATKNYE